MSRCLTKTMPVVMGTVPLLVNVPVERIKRLERVLSAARAIFHVSELEDAGPALKTLEDAVRDCDADS